ncbi:peroxide stress protein YaaA [Nocardioides coralli]|uniref:peroxide stress protein YaaA n=1 Tax=Nocardioides coralli TaxID=2872154 RepID=UPI001CA3B33F|nr:peroxide stress protein YaaA [Nocardioides coralli]QZY30334.1 peroxide stress protein YaaA [Nocardioides coralli]
MLILLPPSEGKTAPARGKPLDLAALSHPTLGEVRRRVLDALVATSHREDAADVLGLGRTQQDLIDRNRTLTTAPTARADRVYTGVLYDALGFDSLSPAARRRSATRVAVTSSLFGLVRPTDRIPAYRLSGDATLPGLGGVAATWREAFPTAVSESLGTGLLVDLRSGTYAAFWKPGPELADRVATVRVLHEVDGKRSVVSHFNKATKGRIVRALLEHGGNPRTPSALARLLGELGWRVETAATGSGTRLDVVVDQV